MKTFLTSFLCFLLSALCGYSQTKSSWTAWEKLYSDNQIKVEIQFKIREEGCQTQKTSKYHYRISGNVYTSTRYVYWKIKYKDCNDQTIEEKQQIAIGGSEAIMGVVESMDYRFVTKKLVKSFYDVSTNKTSKVEVKPEPEPNQPNPSPRNNPSNNTQNGRQDNKKNPTSKRRRNRYAASPFVFKVGGGIYGDMGTNYHLNSNTLNNWKTWKYNPHFSMGGFKRIRNTAHLFGVFYNVGNYALEDYYTYNQFEAGFYFWDAVRMSAGYWAINDEDYTGKEFSRLSATLGLSLKVRMIQLNLNYVQLFSATAPRTAHLRAGIQLSFGQSPWRIF